MAGLSCEVRSTTWKQCSRQKGKSHASTRLGCPLIGMRLRRCHGHYSGRWIEVGCARRERKTWPQSRDGQRGHLCRFCCPLFQLSNRGANSFRPAPQQLTVAVQQQCFCFVGGTRISTTHLIQFEPAYWSSIRFSPIFISARAAAKQF